MEEHDNYPDSLKLYREANTRLRCQSRLYYVAVCHQTKVCEMVKGKAFNDQLKSPAVNFAPCDRFGGQHHFG